MARTARQKSASEIYHVMVRGVNRQDIYFNAADRTRYLGILRDCKEISGFSLYAYCLMPNHVHLLIKSGHESLDLAMKRINCRYAVWFNKKYERVGHLFQDRFKSENVEDERYFLTVLRYIIQNPMKAGMEKAPGRYPWSSYKAYVQGKGELTDVDFATGLAGGRENILHFLKSPNTESALDIPDYSRVVNEDIASKIFLKVTECKTPTAFQKCIRSRQWKMICELHDQNLSIAQISQLTGKPMSTIYSIIKRESG